MYYPSNPHVKYTSEFFAYEMLTDLRSAFNAVQYAKQRVNTYQTAFYASMAEQCASDAKQAAEGDLCDLVELLTAAAWDWARLT